MSRRRPPWLVVILGLLTIGFFVGALVTPKPTHRPDRPGYFMEPSNTSVGYEIIFYPHVSGRDPENLGFEIPCPTLIGGKLNTK